MAKLIIKRTSEWNNRIRDIGIYIDGEKIGVIENGQTKEYDIESGEHQLRTKIDWCGSETMTFNVTDNEIHKVELSGLNLGKWLVPVVLAICAVYFAYGKQIGLNPILCLIFSLPLALYIIYYLTFGRNNYLRLKKI